MLIQERENRRLIYVPVLSDDQGVEALSHCVQKKYFVFSPDTTYSTVHKVQRRMNNKCCTEQKTSEIYDCQD